MTGKEETPEARTQRLGKLLIEYTRKTNNVSKAVRTLEKLKKVLSVDIPGKLFVDEYDW